jgi:hypothetical protein
MLYNPVAPNNTFIVSSGIDLLDSAKFKIYPIYYCHHRIYYASTTITVLPTQS